MTTIATKRTEFLDIFLKLFGVDGITYSKVDVDKIYGTAIYDQGNLEEQQDFCWHITEDDVPSDDVIGLIQIIKNNNYSNGDKVLVSAEELFKKTGWIDRENFNQTFDKLFDIEIKMVDDGEETDSYYLHN